MQDDRLHFVTRDYALDQSTDSELLQQLRAREEIADALYRFALGQDIRDKTLFASAFTEDAVIDFRPAAKKCDLDIPLMRGRQLITDIILNPKTKPDTTHVVSNCRIVITGDEARMTALVEAQHLPVGNYSHHALLKNIYDVRLKRNEHNWQISYMYIDNIWYTGDPRVIIGEYRRQLIASLENSDAPSASEITTIK